jgi:hypothetical protein
VNVRVPAHAARARIRCPCTLVTCTDTVTLRAQGPCALYPHSIRTPSALHPHSIRTPSALHPHSIRTPSALHPHSIHTLSASTMPWQRDKCPMHIDCPSLETIKHCTTCEKYLWILCTKHIEAPSTVTRTSCDTCKIRYWNPLQCSLHSERPSRSTRKDCKLCRQYLCTSCYRCEKPQNGAFTRCPDCREKARIKACKNIDGQKLCTKCKMWKSLEEFNGKDGKINTTCSCRLKNKSRSAQTRTNRLIQGSVPYDHQKLVSVFRELMNNVCIQQNSGLAHYRQGIDMLAAVVPMLSTLNAPGQQAAICEQSESLSSAAHLSHVNWVATSCGELDRFLRTGQALNKHTSTLRITGTFDRYSDAEAAFLRFAEHSAVKLVYQNWRTEGGETPAMPTQQFYERYQSRRSEQVRATFGDFYNFLSISGTALDYIVPEPLFIEKLGYSLLRTLQTEDHLRVQYQTAGGKEAKTRTIDCESCFRFVLYGERYSFSGWHMDVLNGTWLTIVTGFRAWFIYTGPWTKKEQDEFASAGAHWEPHADYVQLILLRPGDTLIMRPGYPVVHCVLTLDDSIARGGMIWSAADIEKIVSNIEFIISTPTVTNEHIPRQLLDYFDMLKEYLHWKRPLYMDAKSEEQLQRHKFPNGARECVVTFIERLKQEGIISCHCKGTCKVPKEVDYARWQTLEIEDPQKKDEYQRKFCRCWWHQEELVHLRGCSTWCHPKGDLANRRCVG